VDGDPNVGEFFDLVVGVAKEHGGVVAEEQGFWTPA